MPNLSLGIVGLPNVGKSTLFNALVKNGQAAASNYPFCTIDPNVGVVEVPDERLAVLADIVHPGRIVPAIVEFTDIAGIIAGASKGEGLGNKFLSHIRETAAIILVARFFEDPDIIHVNGTIDPRRDIEIVALELILADLEVVSKAKDRYWKAAKGGDKEAVSAYAYAEEVEKALNAQKPARSVMPKDAAAERAQTDMHLLTSKPILIVANISEDMLGISQSDLYEPVSSLDIIPNKDWILPICAKLEAELAALSATEQGEFLSEYGLKESGLVRLVRSAYTLLDLETFLTAGPMEVRAWTMPKQCRAPQAAGVIHTDFEKGFIRAEVTACSDYIAYGGELGAKTAGKTRSEGKEYIMHDGDIVHFRFNV